MKMKTPAFFLMEMLEIDQPAGQHRQPEMIIVSRKNKAQMQPLQPPSEQHPQVALGGRLLTR